MKKLLTTALLLTASAAAFAHVGEGEHTGFITGFLHPLFGLDHLAAMLAVGVWSAMTTTRIWAAPLAFALTLLAGALLAQWGIAFPAIEPMIAASMLVVGLLLAARVRLPEAAGAVLVGAFALFHGAAHGQELSGGTALAGMVLGTALLHMVGIVLGVSLRTRSAWVTRIIGAAVALFGLNMGWSLIAG